MPPRQSRLQLEVAALLTRGSAAATMRLLWQLHLLDELFPSLAQRFRTARHARCARLPGPAAPLLAERVSRRLQLGTKMRRLRLYVGGVERAARAL